MSCLSSIRVAAALLPAALLLHEGAYGFAGSREIGAHGYLAAILPLVALVGGSLLIAALLLPTLRPRADVGGAAALRPFTIALALVALFAVQEGTEIVLLGGGLGQLVALLAGSWLLLPLALLLGAGGAAIVTALERAGAEIARLLGVSGRPLRRLRRSSARRPPAMRVRTERSSPLAFGLARRPPPLAL